MDSALTGFGLLYLGISSNYTGELFSCDARRLFTNNIYVKHVLSFLLLTFFIIASDKRANVLDGDWKIKSTLGSALFIYLIFIISTKMSFTFTLPMLTSVLIYVLLDDEKGNKSEETVKQIETWQNYLKWIAIISGIYGFGTYYLKQKNDHSENFDHVKFLFGTTKCRGL